MMRIAFIGIGALGSDLQAVEGWERRYLPCPRRDARSAAQERFAHRKSAGRFCAARGPATSDPAAVGHVDAVFVTTKAWQVTEAAQQIRGIVGPETVVVPLQNGVEAYDQLTAVLGSGLVLDGLCHLGHGYRARRRPACWVQSRDHPRGAEQCTYTTAGEIGRMPHYRRTTDAGTR